MQQSLHPYKTKKPTTRMGKSYLKKHHFQDNAKTHRHLEWRGVSDKWIGTLLRPLNIQYVNFYVIPNRISSSLIMWHFHRFNINSPLPLPVRWMNIQRWLFHTLCNRRPYDDFDELRYDERILWSIPQTKWFVRGDCLPICLMDINISFEPILVYRLRVQCQYRIFEHNPKGNPDGTHSPTTTHHTQSLRGSCDGQIMWSRGRHQYNSSTDADGPTFDRLW